MATTNLILPRPIEAGCVGCNPAIRDFEMTMATKPGFVGMAEYTAFPEPRPIFALDGFDLNIDFVVAVVTGPNGYALLNWSDGRMMAQICDCATITFAVKRNLFRGNVQMRRHPEAGLIIPVGPPPS